VDLNLQKYLLKPYYSGWWRVPGWSENRSEMRPAKNIADSVEALIGAFYLAHSLPGARFFLEFGKLNLSGIDRVPDFYSSTQYLSSTTDAIDCVELEKTIGYQFFNKLFLVEAFTHNTFGQSFNYQRLEFLGDAVLDLVVTNQVFLKYHSEDPETITALKHAAVNNRIFTEVSVYLGLHRFVRFGNASLSASIQELLQHVIKHETVEDNFPYPKIMADLFESLVGAVYLDCGMKMTVVCQVFEPILEPFIKKYADLTTVEHHPMKLLTEGFQAVRLL
jgi:endoribonuclease Dicer